MPLSLLPSKRRREGSLGVGTKIRGLRTFVAPRPHSCRRTLPSVSSARSPPYKAVSNTKTLSVLVHKGTPSWEEFPLGAVPEVADLLDARCAECRRTQPPWLFSRESSGRWRENRGAITDRWVRKVLDELRIRANEELPASARLECLYPHMFRYACACAMDDAGVPIQDIAAYLRHASIETTMRYLDQHRRARRARAAAQTFGSKPTGTRIA